MRCSSQLPPRTQFLAGFAAVLSHASLLPAQDSATFLKEAHTASAKSAHPRLRKPQKFATAWLQTGSQKVRGAGSFGRRFEGASGRILRAHQGLCQAVVRLVVLTDFQGLHASSNFFIARPPEQNLYQLFVPFASARITCPGMLV